MASTAAHRLRVQTAMFMALMFAISCESLSTDLEPDPDEIPPEEVLTISRAAGAAPLPANGTAVDTIYAHLPKDATVRVVSFATSAGSFLPIPGSKTLDVRAEDRSADGRLVAKVALVADTIPTTAVVSAKVGEFVRYLPVSFFRN
jgi:hypothetical protein